MSEFEKNTIILAAFANESAAVGALAGLEHWADSRKEIKLGAVGALREEDGVVSSELLRPADQGALVSGAMGLAKAVLGPVALVGSAVGGVARSLFGGEDSDEMAALQELGALLEAGSVSLVLVATAADGPAYDGQLAAMCGSVTRLEVPQEVLQQVADALEAAREAEEAAAKAEKEAQKAAKQAEKEAKKAARDDE